MRILILSDIHGNITALNAVFDAVKNEDIGKCILLGDLINYGPHSNEVIKAIKSMSMDVGCSVFGNHERAIVHDERDRFSSKRGADCLEYTKTTLNEHSMRYINESMNTSGRTELTIDGKKCLAIHGSLEDPFWKSIDITKDLTEYEQYDCVFSGHSHTPHYYEHYSTVNNPISRNMRKTLFINPGSVGQPRNINPNAQFVIMDMKTEDIRFMKVAYDIEKEQGSYGGQVDDFYRDRLSRGI